jgi:hypothetical protein
VSTQFHEFLLEIADFYEIFTFFCVSAFSSCEILEQFCERNRTFLSLFIKIERKGPTEGFLIFAPLCRAQSMTILTLSEMQFCGTWREITYDDHFFKLKKEPAAKSSSCLNLFPHFFTISLV